MHHVIFSWSQAEQVNRWSTYYKHFACEAQVVTTTSLCYYHIIALLYISLSLHYCTFRYHCTIVRVVLVVLKVGLWHSSTCSSVYTGRVCSRERSLVSRHSSVTVIYAWLSVYVQCTLFTTLYTVHCALYCTLYTTLYTVHCTLHCTLYSTVYTAHYTVHCTMYTVHCTLHWTLYILNGLPVHYSFKQFVPYAWFYSGFKPCIVQYFM